MFRVFGWLFGIPEEKKEIFDRLNELDPACFEGVYSSDISAIRVNGTFNTIVEWVQTLSHFNRFIARHVTIPALMLKPFEEAKRKKFVIELFADKGVELETLENTVAFTGAATEFYHLAKTIDISRSDADYQNSQFVNVVFLQLDSFIQDLIDVQEKIKSRGNHPPHRKHPGKRSQKYLS